MALSNSQPSDSSWKDVFFDGFDALPESETNWSTTESDPPKLFTYEYLHMQKYLRQVHRDHPMTVRLAIADDQRVVIKAFESITDQEAHAQFDRIPVPGHSLHQVKQDMDPFVLEQRAYETIRQRCSDTEKDFFPHYLGTLEGDRKIALEYLRSSLRSRCIFSQKIPPWLETELQLLRQSLEATAGTRQSRGYMKIALELEQRWSESLLIDRLKRLTVLHKIGMTHGDIKEEHFRVIESDFHDTPLFDFSRSYTFTPQRPYMVNGRVIDGRLAKRRSVFRSLQKLVQMEREHTRELVRERVEENVFCEHLAKVCPLICSGPLSTDFQDFELIGMKVFRMPEEFSFPSFASILPFLEDASAKKTPSWIIHHASSLEDYIAAWVGPSPDGKDSTLISVTSHSGECLQECSRVPDILSIYKYNNSNLYLLLIPQEWTSQIGTSMSSYLVEKILSERRHGQKTWTVGKEVFDIYAAHQEH